MAAQGEGRYPTTSLDAETDSKPIIIIISMGRCDVISTEAGKNNRKQEIFNPHNLFGRFKTEAV